MVEVLNTLASPDDVDGTSAVSSSLLPALRPQSPVPTYIGIVVVAIGFLLLAIAWGGVAGENNVAFQMPFLISGGLAGLGFIMVGLTVVNVAAKRRDAALRERQIEILAAALRELRNEDDSP